MLGSHIRRGCTILLRAHEREESACHNVRYVANTLAYLRFFASTVASIAQYVSLALNAAARETMKPSLAKVGFLLAISIR